MINKWTKKEHSQFSLKWTRFDYQKPPKTGYYFRRSCGVIDLIYYDVKTDVVVLFDEDFTIAIEMCFCGFDLDFWAKLPRIPMLKILNQGCIKIC